MKIKFMWDYIQPTNAQLITFFGIEQLLNFASENELLDILEDFEGCTEECIGGYFYHSNTLPFHYVMLLPKEYEENTVWHEALHCAIIMWAQAGAQLHLEDNQEVLTYTQGHIVETIKRIYERKEEYENGV